MKSEWHPDDVKMEEWKRRNPEMAAALTGNTATARDSKVAMLIELNAAGKLDSDTLKYELSKLYAVGTVAEVHTASSPGSAAETIGKTAPKEERAPRQKGAAPCGKEVAAGFVNMHKRHCKDPACTGKSASHEEAMI